MAEDDNTIRSVGPDKNKWDDFGPRAFERSKRNLERIEEKKSLLEETLKNESGWTYSNQPKEADSKSTTFGDVTFTVSSFTQISRPAYKAAVTSFTNYLDSLAYLYSQGHAVTEVIKVDDELYVRAPRARDALWNYVVPLLKSQFKQTVTNKIEGDLKKEKALTELVLPDDAEIAQLTQDAFYLYIRLDEIQKNDKAFVTHFTNYLKKELEKSGKKKATVKVSKDEGYETQLAPVVTPDYLGVVATLIKLPHIEDAPTGELDTLMDFSIPYAEKEERFRHYKLHLKTLQTEGPMVYISIESLKNRVSGLLEKDPSEYCQFTAKLTSLEDIEVKKNKK